MKYLNEAIMYKYSPFKTYLPNVVGRVILIESAQTLDLESGKFILFKRVLIG